MSTAVTPHPRATPRTAAPRIAGWTLLMCWAGLILATFVVGHRASTFEQLEADVVAGEATDLRVAGGLHPGSTGYSVVQVQWRHGVLGYSTEVLEARPRSQAASGRTGSDVTAVLVDESVSDRLARLDPDIAVEAVGWRSSEPMWDGWSRPPWLGVGALVVLGATVWLIVHGPEPRHATRWGWFWLAVIAAPLGALAYLLMSGTTSAGSSASDARRMAGGWAFVLAVLVECAVGVAVAAIS